MPIGDNISKICGTRRLRGSAGKVRCKTSGGENEREDIGGERERDTLFTQKALRDLQSNSKG